MQCEIVLIILSLLLWPPCIADADIIFLPCGFFFFFFFSSPNLSHHRLDVCHTCTHGVALVRILDVGLKHAARSSLKIQDAKKMAKNLPSGRHRTTLSGYIFATKAPIDNWKKPVKQQYLLQMSPQYGERPTSG